jgi:hypothetical protein
MIHSVAYALFDISIGNTIAFSIPYPDLSTELETKSVADYCFPDGAHECYVSMVAFKIDLRSGAARPPNGIPSNQNYLFGAATYHLKKDPKAKRGAVQRSMLVLSWRPLYAAIVEIGRKIIVPFFHRVHVSESETHMRFAADLYNTLVHAFSSPPLALAPKAAVFVPSPERLAAESQQNSADEARGLSSPDRPKEKRVRDERFDYERPPDPGFDMERGIAKIDPAEHVHCEVYEVKVSIPLPSSTMVAAGSVAELAPSASVVAPPEASEANDDRSKADDVPHPESTESNPTASNAVDPASSVEEPQETEPVTASPTTEMRTATLRAPLSSASIVDQFGFGASLRKLVKWFGSNIALIHWALLSRIPVMFVGDTADDVGEAVRACVHLLRPIEVDISRFSPFATIEHTEALRTNAASAVYIALGTTNAYLRETTFPGVIKCNVDNGSLRTSSGDPPKVPKKIVSLFTDMIRACADDTVKEVYVRCRMLRFNLGVLHQWVRNDGLYYQLLYRAPNLIDTPMGTLASENTIREESDSFLLVEEEKQSPGQAALSPSMASETDLLPNASTYLASTVTLDQTAALLKRVHVAIEQFQEAAKKNVEIIEDTESWFHHVLDVLKEALYNASGPSQQALFDEVESFKIDEDRATDPSIHFCGSCCVEGLGTQQSLDRIQRLRFAVDFKERCFLLVDTFARNNPKALRRKGNRSFSDFFNFPDCVPYAFPQQVLFVKSSGTLVTYFCRLKMQTSGTFYISRNFLCFEAGSLAVRKRHQIFPFDVMTNVAQEANGTLKANPVIRLSMDFGSGAVCMAVLSDLGTPKGFFEILQLLFHRQKRLQKLLGNSATLLRCERRQLGFGMLCPLTIPAGMHCNLTADYFDEVWENQRLYPIIGWSSRMLLSDPPAWSDYTGGREKKKDSVLLPTGFVWMSEWEIQSSASVRELIEEDGMGFMENLTASFAAATGIGNSSAAPPSAMPLTASVSSSSPSGSTVKPEDYGWVYGSSWTPNEFQLKPGFGCVHRRRVWIRHRRLDPALAAENRAAAQAASAADGVHPTIEQDDLSTDSSDMMLDANEPAFDAPTVEENNDVRLS